ncbi:MAG: LuxR C-terminal-related transcriptional regulator [Anaerostipes sp.]|nr:LuxR C-terminal-related transcriptional regulator [Anaerostipes sp.]
MEYITTKQAAKKWGIAQRRVQLQCKEGNVDGAIRLGREWMIPFDAKRPLDRRRTEVKKQKESQQTKKISSHFTGRFPCKNPSLGLSNLYQIPGSCAEVAASLSEYPSAQVLLTAQIACAQGEIDQVYAMSDCLLEQADCFEARIGTGCVLAICAMYRGDIGLWKVVKEYMASTPCNSESEEKQLAFWLASVDSSIYDNAGFSEEFYRGSFDFLPLDSFPAARFFYVKCLYLDFNNSVYELAREGKSAQYEYQLQMLPITCELLISQTKAEGAVGAELYLRLICAIAYHNKGEDTFAIEHIDKAIALALPDGLYSPLAEYYKPLDSLLHKRLGIVDPVAQKKVKELSKKLNIGWVKLHNAVLDRSVSLLLTVREQEVAKCAICGLSNKEIAERLHISFHAVKQSMRKAMDKTGAENRYELIKYL